MRKIEYYNNKNVIFRQLKVARKRLRMSQKELAAKMQTLGINIDQQMISKIEKNMRMVTDYELVCFSKALNVDEKELLEDCYASSLED